MEFDTQAFSLYVAVTVWKIETNFADCSTNKNWNFEFSRTAEIFNTKFTDRFKMSTFINVYYYFLTF